MQAHNISANETGTRELVSLVGALDIDTPVVANCIIDQLEAESVLLIPTNAMAYDLLDEEHKVTIIYLIIVHSQHLAGLSGRFTVFPRHFFASSIFQLIVGCSDCDPKL